MSARKLLLSTRALLSQPEKWTKGYFAKTKQNNNCDSISPYAVKWCLLGALAFCDFKERQELGFGHNMEKARSLLNTAIRGTMLSHSPIDQTLEEPQSIEEYNDNHTHSEVMTLLDRAIQLLPN